MPRRSSKKNKNNLEKIKREMSRKKQKAEDRNEPVDSSADIGKTAIEKTAGRQALQIEAQKGTGNECVPEETDNEKIEMLVFRIGEEEFALRITSIKEIIRIPSMTKVPNTPQYISGLCSLRGELLPVVDCRKLFGIPEQELGESSRIIVADIHEKKIGLISDKVLEVINVEEADVKEPPAGIRGADGGVVNGILILNNGKRVIMILDAEKIIKTGDLDTAAKQQHTHVDKLTDSEKKEDEEEQIVVFNIGTGEYGFNINCIKEIIRLPDVMKAPNTASYIEGVLSVRNRLLAVINPGRLLGINCKQPDENSRVIVIDNGNFSYGVIVDKVSQVVRVRKELFKENIQNASFAGIEFVKGILNLNNGQRLIMILEPDKLISLEDVKGVSDVDYKKTANDKSAHDKSLYAGEADDSLEYVVFKLGEEEYGIEINSVQEVNRIDGITRFPGAPVFIAGMVDLRGEIIPVLNLRRLFGMDDSDSYNVSRFLVAESGNKKTGILIDSVSGVLRFSKAYLEEAPGALKEKGQECYIDKIAKLNDGKRIVLVLDLSTMLSFMQD
ncbi:MAG TPA: hypothetical protein GXX36_15760 [Clostridiaceae bacterium]|nr:hypothetical protein [Clostridiaceae bacterium]